jgi:AAA domain-containing protein
MNKDISLKTQGSFLKTKEFQRFTEFCDACRQNRYIGLCYGFPGVGKTVSAWQYANWNLIQPYCPERFYDAYRLTSIERVIAEIIAKNLVPLPAEIDHCRSIIYTPTLMNTPIRVDQEIRAVRMALSYLIDAVQYSSSRGSSDELAPRRAIPDPINLIIIDEADRLKTAALEQIRDIYDRGNIGMVLIGMPGLEKRLSRYPQLYSRVGFVHEFRSLNAACFLKSDGTSGALRLTWRVRQKLMLSRPLSA